MIRPVYLVVTPFFPSPTRWNGAYCYDFVKALMANGKYDVRVFVPGDGRDYDYQGVMVHTFRTRMLPSNILPLLFRRYNERSFLNKVKEVIGSISNNPTIQQSNNQTILFCHAHTANFAIYALAAKRAFGCRALLHHHDPQSFGLNGGILKHCALYNVWLFCRMRKLFEQVDCHVFISEMVKRSFLSAPDASWTTYGNYRRQMRGPAFFHCRPVRIKRALILHNGVDTAIFNRKDKVKGAIERVSPEAKPSLRSKSLEGCGGVENTGRGGGPSLPAIDSSTNDALTSDCGQPSAARQPKAALGDRPLPRAHLYVDRRAMAEKKVEEWLEGVDETTFETALEKLVEEKTAAGEYRFKRPEERELAISGARQFYRDFSRKIIPLSDGRCVYFAPDARAKKRNAANAVAWAEYAFHAVSSSGKLLDGKNFRERLYNATKAADLPVLESIIKAEQCMYRLIDAYPENDAVIFVGRDADDGRLEVITRLDQFGNAEANLGEVTVIAKHKRKENPPPKFRPLTEVVEAVAKHQAAGFSPSTTGNNIANPSLPRKGGGVNSNPSTFNLQPSTFTIGCIGNFVDWKDQDTLIRAVGMMGEKIKGSRDQGIKGSKVREVRVVFVGSGPTLESCKKLAKEIEGKFHCSPSPLTFTFLPEVRHEQLADFYRSLDLFVLPSYFEGFGCVFTEAYACGVPFITCRGQGMDDIVEDDQWLIDPRNAENLSEKVYNIIRRRPKQDLVKEFAIGPLVERFITQLEEK